MTVYPSIIETPEGAFLHLARPGAEAEDIPLSVDQLAALAASASLAIRHKLQRAKADRCALAREWMERDAQAS